MQTPSRFIGLIDQKFDPEFIRFIFRTADGNQFCCDIAWNIAGAVANSIQYRGVNNPSKSDGLGLTVDDVLLADTHKGTILVLRTQEAGDVGLILNQTAIRKLRSALATFDVAVPSAGTPSLT